MNVVQLQSTVLPEMLDITTDITQKTLCYYNVQYNRLLLDDIHTSRTALDSIYYCMMVNQ